MASEKSTQVETTKVSCRGGGADGHPKVFLEIGDDGKVTCPYCSNRFELAGGADENTKALDR